MQHLLQSTVTSFKTIIKIISFILDFKDESCCYSALRLLSQDYIVNINENQKLCLVNKTYLQIDYDSTYRYMCYNYDTKHFISIYWAVRLTYN